MAKQSKDNRKKLNIKFRSTRILSAIILLAIAAGTWAWWGNYRNDPERTFYAAINNSMRTRSVKKKVGQESLGQSLEQTAEVTLGPDHTAHGFTTISQTGQQGANVKTETITKPGDEYVRYVNIDSPGEGGSDYSDILGVWSQTMPSGGEGTFSDLYGEAVLGIVPFADLPAEQRTPVLNFIKENDVYQFKEKDVERSERNNRPIYKYKLTVTPQSYVGMLKKFGEAIGINQFESVNPEDYKDAEAATVNVKVDVLSQQIVDIEYSGGGRSEEIGAQGIYNKPKTPEKFISMQELQSRLQKLQEQ